MNLTDFIQSDDSEVIQVQGIGKVTLAQAKKRVQEMLHDLSSRIDKLIWEPGADQSGWSTADLLIKRGVLQAYLDAITEATKK